MLAVDVVAIGLLRRFRGLFAWCGIMICAGLAAAVLGLVLGMVFENHFGVMRLWCYGIFLHATALLITTGVLWRKARPRLACTAILAALSLVAVAADAFLVEPHWLEVTHRRIASPKIHKPVRIVVLADLQTDVIGPFERRVMQQVADEKPDILLFAGDYIQSSWEEQESLRKQFQRMMARWPFGELAKTKMFAVRGNCDPDDWHKVFEDTGYRVSMVDATRTFDLGDIRLTCLEVGDSFNPSFSIANDKPEHFSMVFGHAPNFALGKVDADLLISGHTHGGQVQLPWIGPLITLSRVPRAWASGLTELPRGGKLLVSRGIGMERTCAPRIRFLCRPELTVIDLVPEEEPK
jgi:uncharacterized protein